MAKNFEKVMKKKDLGSGLLSENSRQFAVNEFKVTYIPLDQLVVNQRNEGFTMDDIEELKTSIREVGLEQNLVVVPDGDHFRILTGHRRFLALRELYAEGMGKFRTVPCIVKDLSKIDLPLSESSKELYAIATTNLENRRYTDADKLKLMEMLSQVYDELKANGYERLGKRRDFLAERLGISSAGVQILSYVNKNIDDSFRNAFLWEEIPLMVANEIAHLNRADQIALHEYLEQHPNPNLSVKDVRDFAERRRKEAEEASFPKADPTTAPDIASFTKLQAEFRNLLAEFDEFPMVTSADALRLRRIQNEMTARIQTAEKIVQKYRSRRKKD